MSTKKLTKIIYNVYIHSHANSYPHASSVRYVSSFVLNLN